MSWRYLCCLLAIPSAVLADVVSPTPEAVEVTIYRAQAGLTADIVDKDAEPNGLAMITETRTIDLPAGTSTIAFRGVAETIVPQSAKLESLPGQIVETNFDYSLIGPGELIAKSIGKVVRLVRTDKNTGKITEQRATLLSGPQGMLLDIDGKVEALNCSGATEKLVFDEVPASLTTDPTLSATIRTTQAGRYRLRLSYLALGLDWSADYVARIHPNGRTLDLSGWITLVNKQSTSFPDAQVHVVAGNVSVLRDETVPQDVEAHAVVDKCWPIGSFYRGMSAAAPDDFRYRALRSQALPINVTTLDEIAVTGSFIAAVSQLGDYKLYSLPVTTTVAAQQIKQVQMIDQLNVPFERIYTYVVEPDELGKSVNNRPVSTLRLQNKKSAGLGIALPAGTASVMEHDSRDRLVLAGEQTLRDLPVGMPVDIELGAAVNIFVQPRVVREYDHGRENRKTERLDIEIDMANDKPVPIQLEVFQRKQQEQDFRIVSQSQRHSLKHGMPMWTFTMKPGERTTLRYTVEHAE